MKKLPFKINAETLQKIKYMATYRNITLPALIQALIRNEIKEDDLPLNCFELFGSINDNSITPLG